MLGFFCIVSISGYILQFTNSVNEKNTMLKNISQITELMHEKRINKKRLSELSGYSASSISEVLNGKTPLTERFARIMSNVLEGNSATVINGTSHHIDINHVAERAEHYSPATEMLLDIISEWSEKKRRKLAAYAVSLNGDEEEEG